MTDVKKFNNQSFGEELANSISHGVGSALAIAGTVCLIVYACFTSDAMGIVGAALYGASLILLYMASTLYHAFTNKRVKRVFQVFDHCSIFILIVGTYIPICFTALRGTLGWILFGINMGCAVLGIVLNAIDLHRWHKLSLVLYVIMGWSIAMAVKPVIEIFTLRQMLFLIIGGICYTAGIIFYVNKKVKYFHFVWHIFVLMGSVFHYFFVLLECY